MPWRKESGGQGMNDTVSYNGLDDFSIVEHVYK